MNEFDLIRRYFTFSHKGQGGMALGVGDDCALLDVPPGHQLAVTTDTLVSGVHFPIDGPPDLIARRALRVNLSDLAAMGAAPLGFQLALTLPDINPSWLAAFSAGLAQDANAFTCPLTGGDTTRGPLTITITMMGSVRPDAVLRRSGARAGDIVCVSGRLGGAALALEYLADLRQVADLHSCYWLPEPRLQLGQLLAAKASSALDISDGLLQDLAHIARASGLRAQVYHSAIPIQSRLRGQKSPDDAVSLALTGGDDYELCFTASEQSLPEIEILAQQWGCDISRIGRMLPTVEGEPTVVCVDESGRTVRFGKSGYDHFGV